MRRWFVEKWRGFISLHQLPDSERSLFDSTLQKEKKRDGFSIVLFALC